MGYPSQEWSCSSNHPWQGIGDAGPEHCTASLADPCLLKEPSAVGTWKRFRWCRSNIRLKRREEVLHWYPAGHEMKACCERLASAGPDVRSGLLVLGTLFNSAGVKKVKEHSRRTCIVEVNLVFRIQICAPVTDFQGPLVWEKFYDWLAMFVMYRYGLLMRRNKLLVWRGRNIVVGAISDRCAWFCRRRVMGKLWHILWLCEGDNLRRQSPWNSASVSARYQSSYTNRSFVRCTAVKYGLVTKRLVENFSAWSSPCATFSGRGLVACVCTVSKTMLSVPFTVSALGSLTSMRWYGLMEGYMRSTECISFDTHELWSSLLSSMESLSFLPLILTSSQLVFSLSSALREMVYVFAPGSSALIAYVVVACTREPPSSTVRTMAEFSNEAAEAKEAR